MKVQIFFETQLLFSVFRRFKISKAFCLRILIFLDFFFFNQVIFNHFIAQLSDTLPQIHDSGLPLSSL